MFVISQIDFATSRQRYVSAYLVLTALNYLVIPASVQKFIIIMAYYKYHHCLHISKQSLTPNMSRIAIPVVLCGRTTAIGRPVSQFLRPEYEGTSHFHPVNYRHLQNT